MITFVDTPTFNLPKLFGWLLLAIFSKLIIKMVYNAYLSPLRVIPGPKLCSLTEFLVTIRRPEGRVFEWFYQLHLKYGSVVRVGPKFILFSSKEAVRQILVTSVCINLSNFFF